MPDNVIELKVSAHDDGASATIEKLAGSFEKLKGVFEAYLGFEGLKKLVETIDEAQLATQRLDNVLRNVGNVGVSRSFFDDFAEQIQKTTRYSDNAVKGMEALLVTFQHLNGEELKRALQVTVDLADRFGSLDGAARSIGRALNEPTQALGALSRQGIQFDQSTQKVIQGFIDQGKYAAAQNVILTQLEATTRGAAEAAGNTLGGALAKLKNNFATLFEGKNASGVNEVAKAINGLAETLANENIKHGIDVLIEGLATVSKYAIQAAAAVGNFFAAGPASSKLTQADDILAKYQKQLEEITTTRSRASVTHVAENPDETPRYDANHLPLNAAALRERIKFWQDARAQLVAEQNHTDTALSGGNGRPSDVAVSPLTEFNVTAIKAQSSAIQDFYDELNTATQTSVDKQVAALDVFKLQLDELRSAGKLSAQEFGDRWSEELDRVFPEFQVTLKKMDAGTTELTENQRRALEVTQDAFANTFLAIGKGWSGWLTSMLQAFERFFAQVAAKDLVKALGLDKAITGDSGGSTLGTIFSGIFKAFSAGGTDAGSGPTWVGEEGRELVNLPSGSQVMNARQLAFNAGSGGDVNYAPVTQLTVTPANGVTPEQLSQVIAYNNQRQRDELFRTLRRNGLGTIRA